MVRVFEVSNEIQGNQSKMCKGVRLLSLREWIEQDEILIQKLQTLGLGQSIDKDIYHPRQLFVDRVQSNDFYQMLIGTPLLDLNTEMERFREEGTFCGEVGDLVIKVCSDILCVPIMLVTNIAGTPYLPFIPDESVTDQPLFVAFMALGPGHYDATNKVQNEKGNPCSQTST